MKGVSLIGAWGWSWWLAAGVDWVNCVDSEGWEGWSWFVFIAFR